jgi:hypothetical protein
MKMPLRDMLTDAIRYWERRRIAYNAILAAFVAFVFVLRLPESRSAMSAEQVLTLFIFAVLANVAYCAAYVVDLIAQYSTFQATWKRYRWLVFVTGVVFAATKAMPITADLLTVLPPWQPGE